MQHEKILILDFGAQYTQLIARRVREAKVYCEIHPHDVPDDFVRGFGASGIILSGKAEFSPIFQADLQPPMGTDGKVNYGGWTLMQ